MRMIYRAGPWALKYRASLIGWAVLRGARHRIPKSKAWSSRVHAVHQTKLHPIIQICSRTFLTTMYALDVPEKGCVLCEKVLDQPMNQGSVQVEKKEMHQAAPSLLKPTERITPNDPDFDLILLTMYAVDVP